MRFWVYNVNGTDIHLETNIWDYITYDSYVDGEVPKTPSGKTYKIDFGEMADDLGWSLRIEGFGVERIHYDGCLIEPFGEVKESANKYGFYPITKYMPFIWDDGVDKAVFVPVFWGETDTGGAMSYEHIIAVTYAMEAVQDYCCLNGTDNFNEHFQADDGGLRWLVNEVAPQFLPIYGPRGRGAVFLNSDRGQ